MSGYDNSPDYGGTDFSLMKIIKIAAIVVAIAAAALVSIPVFAAAPPITASKFGITEIGCKGCGCRGGPGWRSERTGKCVGEKQLRKECGSPPSKSRCTKEN